MVMVALKTPGIQLNGRGWNTAITSAGIVSSDVIESLVRAAHLTGTRHAHQVTVSRTVHFAVATSMQAS